MSTNNEIEGAFAHLSIERPEKLTRIAHALSSPLRVAVIYAVSERSMSVGELAQKLDVPMSTMALAVRTLEEADLITITSQAGLHGTSKICSRKLSNITVSLVPEYCDTASSTLVFHMPIGGYSSTENIEPTCGILSEAQAIGPFDISRIFYSTQRFDAQLLWFRHGFLEYHFSTINKLQDNIDYLEISFESCSEAPLYCFNWPSDISVEVNRKRLGTWTCPSDCGGRHGHLTPQWWDNSNTQYGFLKTWHIDRTGSYLDYNRISDLCISDLDLTQNPYISVRIGVDPNAKHANGINLFGEKFGDHPQGIKLQIGFSL